MFRADTEAIQGIRAAAYVRMSTDHQYYSTSNQSDVIREYANRRGMVIVKTYSDEGKSGLNIQGRDSLAQMIKDVQSGEAGFSCILVYDISRWGRFQDADESAYYEYLCRRAGIAVHYCAEQFENDGSPISTIVKGVKRAMAGEFSRELSTKVFQGACRLIQMGYRQGGTAGYGFRRMLIDQNGQPKGLLQLGEVKSLQSDRVVLVPGPDEEVQVVRWIYKTFLSEGKRETEIASILNEKGILGEFGRPWTAVTVHGVLTNLKYVGDNVYHRRSCKLKGKNVRNHPDKWIKNERAFPALIERDVFFSAKKIISARTRKFTDEQMLEGLRQIYAQSGCIRLATIKQLEDMPKPTAYRLHFGSLIEAYHQVGYHPYRSFAYIHANRRARKMRSEIIAAVIQKLEERGAEATWDARSDLLEINGSLRVFITLCRQLGTKRRGTARWSIPVERYGRKPDITIGVRLDADCATTLDYYVLPSLDMEFGHLRLADDNGLFLDIYRFHSLDRFYEMAQRTRIKRLYERPSNNDPHPEHPNHQPASPGQEPVRADRGEHQEPGS